MMKRSTVLSIVLLMIFSLSVGNLMAQRTGNGKQKNSPPFLITGSLPHLTRLLMQQWDNTELQLSDEQKSKLLVVRQETIAGAQKLGSEIAPLEKQVAEKIFAGKTPEELQSVVQAIAKLKAEATMLHLRCIYSTRGILDQQQMEFLKNM
ncbi:MAG: hypothetical protein KKD01_12010 [Proteobacteria bacterium]|nr:hypothetical protein [Pseudomonadota bacterium]MBU1455444.1 hypothetical protein [Pseudomonadota bacterium]